jgi:hypothetical protein
MTVGQLRASAISLMKHTYTRTPVVPRQTVPGTNDLDEWGDAIFIDGTPVTGQRCRYHPEQTGLLENTGETIEFTPELHVPPDDPLAARDKVSNIQDFYGVVAPGPFLVLEVTPRDVFGVVLERVATLRGGQVTT